MVQVLWRALEGQLTQGFLCSLVGLHLHQVGVRFGVGLGLEFKLGMGGFRLGKKVVHPVFRMDWWYFLPRLVPRVGRVVLKN